MDKIKYCRSCGTILNDKNWTEGMRKNRDYMCKSCRKKKTQKWYETHPEGRKAIARRFREKNRERMRKYHREYARNRRKDLDYRIKDALKTKIWQEQNKDKVWINRTFRSHKNRDISFLFSKEQLKELIRKPIICKICGSLLDINSKKGHGFSPNCITVDIIDRKKDATIDNIQIVCGKCNLSKSQMSMDEFRGWIKTVYLRLFNVSKTTRL